MLPHAKGKNLSERIQYRPANVYPYDLEIFQVSDLKKRTSKEAMFRTYNYEFYMLILITHGQCEQVIDFQATPCSHGDLIVLRPGQSHNFGRDQDWDGWVILFRPEFVMSASTSYHGLMFTVNLEHIPEQLTLNDEELQRVMGLIGQMRADAFFDGPIDIVHALLRHQVLTLLTMLILLRGRRQIKEDVDSHALRRFKQFQSLVDEFHAKWHQVAEYAARIGCTEKSLSRASLAALGITAKAFIASRITLEAKRLLAHTDMPITTMAEKLGFEETTNFTKFFKRGAGCTPSEFRRGQAD